MVPSTGSRHGGSSAPSSGSSLPARLACDASFRRGWPGFAMTRCPPLRVQAVARTSSKHFFLQFLLPCRTFYVTSIRSSVLGYDDDGICRSAVRSVRVVGEEGRITQLTVKKTVILFIFTKTTERIAPPLSQRRTLPNRLLPTPCLCRLAARMSRCSTGRGRL